jgi:hypothetical protein
MTAAWRTLAEVKKVLSSVARLLSPVVVAVVVGRPLSDHLCALTAQRGQNQI